MKKIFTLISSCLLLGAVQGSAQVFWTENFTGGSTGLEVGSYSGTNGAWSLMVTGSEGADPNPWFVSCQEAGHLAGVCGTTCASSAGLGESLHVGSSLGDGGASYDAGGLCPFICPQTDRRAQSPTINCTGKTNIRLKFYYILNGQGTTDDGSVYYSADNGGTWSLLLTPAKTLLCSGQGKWDSTSVALPATANNNPTVKIGFRWVNNDDGAGTDPSFAVDSVSLRVPASTGPAAASMTASAMSTCRDSCLTFTNTSTGTVDSFKWSCPAATIVTPTASPATICFTVSGTQTVKLNLYNGGIKVDSASTTITVNPAPSPVITKTGTTLSVPAVYTSYQWYSVGLPPTPIAGATNATFTYTMAGTYGVVVDSGGCKGIAYLNTLGFVNLSGADNVFWLAEVNNNLTLHTALPMNEPISVDIYDATGRKVFNDSWQKGNTTKQIGDIALPQGLYIIKLSNSNTSAVLKWLKH